MLKIWGFSSAENRYHATVDENKEAYIIGAEPACYKHLKHDIFFLYSKVGLLPLFREYISANR